LTGELVVTDDIYVEKLVVAAAEEEEDVE